MTIRIPSAVFLLKSLSWKTFDSTDGDDGEEECGGDNGGGGGGEDDRDCGSVHGSFIVLALK